MINLRNSKYFLAKMLLQVMVELMPSISSASQDLFHHMTTMINPTILKRKGVNVTTVIILIL